MKAWTSNRVRLRESYGAAKYQHQLFSSFLNIDGLSAAKLVDVRSYASKRKPDIFFLLETKRREEEVGSDISVPGYDLSEIRRSDAADDKQGGGIAFYTKASGGVLFKRHSPDIAHADLAYVDNERFWVTVETQHSKTAVCGSYFGCQFSDDRNQSWNDGMYWVLQQEVLFLRSQGYRIQMLGDFNAHVGCHPNQGISGNNPDVNRNGERFLSFLLAFDLTHVNGALRHTDGVPSKVCDGLWTRQRGASRSVVDYAVMSSEHMDSVVSMTVDEAGVLGGGSDHNWIEIILVDKIVNLVKVDTRPKKKNVWNIKDEQDWSAFQDAVVRNLPADVSEMSVDDLASLVASVYRTAGVSSIGYKRQQSRRSMHSQSLPDNVVKALDAKSALGCQWKTFSNSGRGTPGDVAAAEAAFNDQAEFVDGLFESLQTVERARKWSRGRGKSKRTVSDFWGAVTGKVVQSSEIRSVLTSTGVLKTGLDDILCEVEKHLCSTYKGSMEPLVPGHRDVQLLDHCYSSRIPPPSVLPEHSYSKRVSPKLPKIGCSDELEKNPSNWLAKDFSAKEIKVIASKLSNGKARGWDNIPSEFIKYSPPQMFDLLALLFTKVKNSGTFPSGWNCGRITLIHKKGLRAKLGNYRPITVIIALSGFYSKLLNERLIEVVETFSLLGEIQNGFRKNRGGSDNIFILNTALWKARAMGEKLHMGFVDIQKAYDSVDREILWQKLAALGIDGVFLGTLKAMYDGDSVRCTVNGVTTGSVFLKRGLRQGCSLSPMLFALYIVEIGEDLAASKDGLLLSDIYVSGLLFADDIVLISRTAEGLKRLFRIVKHHCDKLLLEVNTGEGKTEVVSPTDDLWEIFDPEGVVELSLRRVVEYSYLGLETTSSILRTTRAKQTKCLKIAKKYKFACLHIGGSGPDVVDASLATWNQIALPTILYGCESIVFSESTIIGLERIQSEIAKNILGLSTNTVNIAAQTELGILPFRFSLYKSQLRFYFRVLALPDTRWVKKALMEHLSTSWPSPYLRNVVAIRERVCLPFVPPTLRYLGSHLLQWSLSETNHLIAGHHLPYVGSLTKYSRQPYVFEHPQLATIAQFRLSNAGLGNRYPRFAGLPYVRQKLCPLCVDEVLTEAHVIFFCPSVERFRKEFELNFFRTVCRTQGYGKEETFNIFINGHDWNGNPVPDTDFASRGLALDTIRGHWLSLW